MAESDSSPSAADSSPPTAASRAASAAITTVVLFLIGSIGAYLITLLQHRPLYTWIEHTPLATVLPYVLLLVGGGGIWYRFTRGLKQMYRPYPRVTDADSSRTRRRTMRWAPPLAAAETIGIAIVSAVYSSWNLLPGVSLALSVNETWYLLGLLTLILVVTLWELEYAYLREHETNTPDAETASESDQTTEHDTERFSFVD